MDESKRNLDFPVKEYIMIVSVINIFRDAWKWEGRDRKLSLFSSQKESPIDRLREHASLYMEWIRLGQAKFRKKEIIRSAFEDLSQAEILYEQAMSGSIYDYKKKLDPMLWEAVEHEYREDMPKLKKAEEETPELTEEEKKELNRIISGLESEYEKISQIADDWFAVHGKNNGCLGFFLFAVLGIPAAAGGGIWFILSLLT